jgi:hypothetical protein
MVCSGTMQMIMNLTAASHAYSPDSTYWLSGLKAASMLGAPSVVPVANLAWTTEKERDSKHAHGALHIQ